MAVKIRLQRHGKKNAPFYFVVVADARSPRDGKFIEKLGSYNPNTNPATIELNTAMSLEWIRNGAQPTETAKRILSYKGVFYKKYLETGIAKGVLTQEQADVKMAEWLSAKDNKVQGKVEGLVGAASKEAKARFAAELKVKAARAEAIVKKNTPPPAPEPEVEEVAEVVAEVAAPEVIAEVAAPEVIAEVAAPEVVAEVVAEVAAPEVVAEVVAEIAAPEVVAEVVAEVAASEAVAAAETTEPEETTQA